MSHLRHSTVAAAAGLCLSLGIIGCQPDHPEVVPPGAAMTTSGNSEVTYTAPQDGTVFVYDHPGNRLLWSGKVISGEVVQIDPQKNQIVVNGRIVANKTLTGGDRNDIWFQPSPNATLSSQRINNQANNADSTGAMNNPNSVTVTPTVRVQQGDNSTVQPGSGSVTVSPGLQVSPATQPSQDRTSQQSK